MSLQVWLPLNGNLNNQGLSNLTFSSISSNTTMSDAGKIGKCYTNNSNSSGGLLSSGTINLGQKQSMFCWVKFTSLESSCSLGGGLVSQHRYDSNSGMGLTIKYVSSTTGYLSVNTGNGSSRTYNSYCGTTLLQANTWYHVGYTYDGSNIRLYANGVLEKTQAYVNMSVPSDYITVFCWSMSGTSGNSIHGEYKLNGSINDVRIYDHCLSQKEIREISKGLVLHYKLDDSYLESTTNISSQTSKGGWNNSGSASRETNNNSLYKDAPYPDNVYSIKVTTAGNCALTFGNTTTNVPSKTLTCSVYCYLSGTQDSNTIYIRSSKTDGNIGAFSYNGSTNPSTWPVNRWIRLSQTITTNSEATTIYFCTYANTLNNIRAFCGWQIEEKNHVTPFTSSSRSETIIHDCSGYNRNGTKIGSVTCDINSPRYSTSYNLTDSASAILLGNLSTYVPDGVLTFNIWFKKTTGEWSSKSYETILGGPSGFELEMKPGSTNSPTIRPYSWDGSGGAYDFSYSLDNWHMLTMVRTTSSSQFYLDGELKATGSAGSVPSGNYYFGSWSNETKQNYRGRLVDARIYATALSADDIKELYNTSTSISNAGEVFTREIVEV